MCGLKRDPFTRMWNDHVSKSEPQKWPLLHFSCASDTDLFRILNCVFSFSPWGLWWKPSLCLIQVLPILPTHHLLSPPTQVYVSSQTSYEPHRLVRLGETYPWSMSEHWGGVGKVVVWKLFLAFLLIRKPYGKIENTPLGIENKVS